MSAGRRRLELCRIDWDRIDFELVVDGRVERTVAVIRDSRGRIEFPHLASDAGESLGSEVADAHARQRARDEFVRLDGPRGRRR